MIDYPGDLLLHLAALRAVAASAGQPAAFFKAARALGVDESVVRKRLVTLSGHAGGALFEGRASALRLTREGEKALSVAERALAAVEELGKPVTARLSIGCTGTIASEVLPAVVARLRRAHPSLIVHVRRFGAEGALAAITSGELDLAVIRAPSAPRGVASTFVAKDKLMFAVRSNSPLARASINLAKIARVPLITFRPASSTRARVMSVLEPLGAIAHIEVESKSLALRYVELAMGVAFVSVLPGTQLVAPKVVLRDVTKHFPPVSFWAIWREHRALRVWEREAIAALRRG